MGNRKRSQFWESAIDNNVEWSLYYNRLIEIALSRYEWKGLPDSIDPRFLELALFTDGHALFFEDEVMGYLALRCTLGGRMNVYNEPISRQAYAANSYRAKLDIDNSVIVWNNFMRTPSYLQVISYAKRLYNMDRIIDVNTNAQKTPVLIKCLESQRLSLENLYAQYDGNKPVIFANDKLNPDALSVLKTDAPFIAPHIQMLKKELWNEALTFLGVPNSNEFKRERQITSEVAMNNGTTIACRYSNLAMRQLAAEKANKMFGVNWSCEYRNFTAEDLGMPSEVIENEQVHN